MDTYNVQNGICIQCFSALISLFNSKIHSRWFVVQFESNFDRLLICWKFVFRNLKLGYKNCKVSVWSKHSWNWFFSSLLSNIVFEYLMLKNFFVYTKRINSPEFVRIICVPILCGVWMERNLFNFHFKNVNLPNFNL